jgi:hypothetical protein
VEATWATSQAIEGEDPNVNPLAELIHPVDLATGPGDSIYVADKGGYRIVIYDPDGHPVRTLGRIGEGPGEFTQLRGVSVDDRGRIWALEVSRLQVLAPSGQAIASTGEVPPPTPSNLATISPDGALLLCDGLGAIHAYRLSTGSAAPRISKTPLNLELHARGVTPNFMTMDMKCSLAPRPGGGYAVLLPAITVRKGGAWLQEYDAAGTLLRDYDLTDKREDLSRLVSSLKEGRSVSAFLPLKSGAAGRCYVASVSGPFVICLYDWGDGRLIDAAGAWVGTAQEGLQRLESVIDVEIDSRGRLDILSRGDDGLPLLLQAHGKRGGDAG